MKYLQKITYVFVAISTIVLQADVIIADRPGFSTGTYTVGQKNLNVELGYNYTKNDQTLPLAVLRTGITDRLEFDMMYDGIMIQNNNTTSSWSSDVTIGVKYRLYESELYNLTFMALTSLPMGDNRSISSKNTTPLMALLWDYTVSMDISLFGTLQGSTYYDKEQIYDFQPAVGISMMHTKKLGSYIEYYSVIPSSKYQDNQQVIDGGIIYFISDDIQLDLNGGIGLNSVSDDFIGFGIAMQF